MYQFWRNNKNVLMVAVGMFVVSVTTLIILLNNENLNLDLKADVINDGASNGEHTESVEVDYSKLAPDSKGPTLVVGLDGLIDFANEAYKKQTRYLDSEVKDQLFFGYIHPEDLAGILSAYGKVLSSKQSESMVGPFRMKNASGEYSLQMAAMMPLIEDDKLVGVSIETHDISDKLKDASSSVEYEVEELEKDQQQSESEPEFEEDESVPQEQESSKQEIEDSDEAEVGSGTSDENIEFSTKQFAIPEVLPKATYPEKDADNSWEGNTKNQKEVKEKSEPEKKVEKSDKEKSDKKIRDNSDKEKRLVVDNLARVVNKVYRDPDILASLF